MGLFEELSYVRVTSAQMFKSIPRKLLDDIKDKDYDTDALFSSSGALFIPSNFMFFLIDKDSSIKGFLWFYLNLPSKKAQVNVLTVDKEFQNTKPILKVAEFIKSLGDDLTIEIMTSRPAAFLKAGFKKSNTLILEL